MTVDLRARALEVVESQLYVVLATVSPDGAPWSCPVWFAHDGLDRFFWVSRPYRTHSVNISHEPRIGLVTFDSRQPTGVGSAVYAAARARVAHDAEIDDVLEIVSERSLRHGGKAWERARLASSPLELYVAETTEVWLNPGEGTDIRERVPDAGRSG